MTQTAAHEREPIHVHLGVELRFDDEELFRLCQMNRELRIERDARGDLEIMTPVGSESSSRNAELTYALVRWAKRDATGIAFDSSAGFLLPNGAMRSPDAAWIHRDRWQALDDDQRQRFPPVAPDFVAELRSPSDSLEKLRAKMAEWIENGVRLGWLIDPETRQVEIYRPERRTEVLKVPGRIVAGPDLPGFELSLTEIWR